MKFIELHGIDPYLHTNSRFDSRRLTVLESDQLNSHPLHVIQYIFGELFQQQFCIRLHQTVRTVLPCFSFCTQISVIQIIIAIIYQISFKRSSHHRFCVFGHISQKYIQSISSTHLRLTLNDRHLRFYRFNWFFRFRSRRTGFTPHIIVICFNHDTLAYRHWNIKPIRIFYQHKILSLESSYDSTAYLTKKAYFISYFHYCISN